MRLVPIPGGLWTMALATGEYAAMLADPRALHLETHLGLIPTKPAPDGTSTNPLYLDITTVGGFKIAGQATNGEALGPAIEYVQGSGWRGYPQVPSGGGGKPCLYTRDGQLHIATADLQVGAGAWRCEDPDRDGVLISGDATYASNFGLWEYTPLGDGYFVGLCSVELGAAFYNANTKTLRVIIGGDVLAVRGHRDRATDRVAVSVTMRGTLGAAVLFATIAELEQFPVAVPTVTLPPIGPFSHDVLVAVYKDPKGETSAPAEIVVNQYPQETARPYFVADDSIGVPAKGRLLGINAEAKDPRTQVELAKARNTRVLWVWDSTTHPEIPSCLRPEIDIPCIEFYLSADETIEQTITRWVDDMRYALAKWPGALGGVVQLYGQWDPERNAELWPEQAVLDGLAPLTAIVNMSARIEVVAVFAYLRANGIAAHPIYREALDRMVAASPGLPAWARDVPPSPVPVPPAPPTPAPRPVPVSSPLPFLPRARVLGVVA
jgi:hypothetical protein